MAVKIPYQYKDYGDDKKATEISHKNASSRAMLSPLVGIGMFMGVFVMADGFSRKDYQVLIGGIIIAGVLYYFLYSTYVSPIEDDIQIDAYRIEKFKNDSSISNEQKEYLVQKKKNDEARKKSEIKNISQKAIKYLPIFYIVSLLLSLFFWPSV